MGKNRGSVYHVSFLLGIETIDHVADRLVLGSRPIQSSRVKRFPSHIATGCHGSEAEDVTSRASEEEARKACGVLLLQAGLAGEILG